MTEEGTLITRKTLPAELVAKLKQPLPAEAVHPHPTKPYLSTIKVPFVVERLNDVFGLGGWDVANEIVESTEMVVVKSTLTVPEYGIRVEQFGGNDNSDRGDAYKGACTDALSKIGSYLYIGMDVYKGIRDVQQAPRQAAKPTTVPASTTTTTGNQISFLLAEWREEEGKFGPILMLTPAAPIRKGGSIVAERFFKNKNNAAYFEKIKDCVGKTLVFTTEKKGNYTNLKELVSVDGKPLPKINGTMPPAVQFSDGTQITDQDIPF